MVLKAKLVPAVAYYRYSSDAQDSVSIARQRAEVTPYAKAHGYQIVAEYVDESKTASKDDEKRIDFQRMLADSFKGEWRAVLCWDSARFGRLDTIDGAFGKQTLRGNSIFLDTVKEGKIDWSTEEGRIKDFFLGERNHAYSRNLAKDAISGRLERLRDGWWCNGTIPYGFDREYHLEDGGKKLVSRTDRYQKSRRTRLKLVESPEESKIVRLIFDLFVNQDISIRQIAIRLNQQKIPGPGEATSHWSKGSVRDVLLRKAYIGVASIGEGRQTKRKRFHSAERTENPGACPALVDAELFQDAQKKLARIGNKEGTQTRHGACCLSGILYCAHCGFALSKKPAYKGRVYLACDSATRRQWLGCKQWRIYEDEILPVVVTELVQRVDEETLRLSEAKPGEPSANSVLLEKTLAGLRAKFDRACERAALEEDDTVARSHRNLAVTLKTQIQETEIQLQTLRAIEDQGGLRSFLSWWHENREGLIAINSAWQEGDRLTLAPGKPPAMTNGNGESIRNPALLYEPDTLRGLLKRFGCKVSIHWTERERHSRRERAWIPDSAKISVDFEHLPDTRSNTCDQKLFKFSAVFSVAI